MHPGMLPEITRLARSPGHENANNGGPSGQVEQLFSAGLRLARARARTRPDARDGTVVPSVGPFVKIIRINLRMGPLTSRPVNKVSRPSCGTTLIKRARKRVKLASAWVQKLRSGRKRSLLSVF